MNSPFIGYVINLNRHAERLQNFYHQADAQYFIRVPAIDRKVLDLLENDTLYFHHTPFEQRFQRKITLGEIGCTLSHISCWQKIAENPQLADDDFAIVAEDDVRLAPHFAFVIQQVKEHMLKNNDKQLIILQKLRMYHPHLQIYQGDESKFQLLSDSTTHLFDDDGSALYMIRKDRAKALVQFLKERKPYWLADHFSQFCPVEYMAVLHPLLGVVPDDADSDLEEIRNSARKDGL